MELPSIVITIFGSLNTALEYGSAMRIRRCYVAGGDDCQFHVYDLRIGTQHPISSSKVHEAGVTSLHSNALYENLLASGRYRKALKVDILQCFVTGYL
jgi:hypothetical protein